MRFRDALGLAPDLQRRPAYLSADNATNDKEDTEMTSAVDPTPKHKLGLQYRDTVSGFEGILTANYVYLAGCVRCQLTGKFNPEKGEAPELVFDEEQIELVEDGEPALPAGRRSGGAMSSTPVAR